MRNVTIRQRILGSFAVIMVLMIVMGSVDYMRLTLIEHVASDIQTSSMYYGAEITSVWVMDYGLVEEFVLENDKAEIASVDAQIRANHVKLEGLLKNYDAIGMEPKERENFEAFKTLQDSYNRAKEAVLKLGLDNKDEEAQTLARTQLKPIFEKAQAALQVIGDFNKVKADESTRQTIAGMVAAQTGIVISIAIALLISVVTGYYLLRAITGPLARISAVMSVMRLGDFTQRLATDSRDEFGLLAEGFNGMTDELTTLVGQVQKSGIQVNTSIMEIAATSKEQQATASEISATTTEIGATSKEISATSKELVRTMNEVAAVAEQTAALAGNGQTGLSRMEEMMGHVMEAAGSINAKLAVLNEKAGNINQVVTTITKVADQTNLLSLNAAIEAEKAGEYGRGFAVVATEIRRLADQTSVATYDIELMVKEIHSAVSAGVMGMDKFSEEVRRGMQEVQQVGGQLSQIIQQVLALVPRFETVNEGMQAQATGAEQISDALKQLSEAAQQTVESLRQSSQAIDELNQVSSGLRGSVSRFKLQT